MREKISPSSLPLTKDNLNNALWFIDYTASILYCGRKSFRIAKEIIDSKLTFWNRRQKWLSAILIEESDILRDSAWLLFNKDFVYYSRGDSTANMNKSLNEELKCAY